MPTITITWTLSAVESALLDKLLAANYAIATEQYAMLLIRSQQDPEVSTPIKPVAETREAFITRIGLKGIKGTLQIAVEALQKANIATVINVYEDPATTDAQKIAALDQLGLQVDGLRIIKKNV